MGNIFIFFANNRCWMAILDFIRANFVMAYPRVRPYISFTFMVRKFGFFFSKVNITKLLEFKMAVFSNIKKLRIFIFVPYEVFPLNLFWPNFCIFVFINFVEFFIFQLPQLTVLKGPNVMTSGPIYSCFVLFWSSWWHLCRIYPFRHHIYF